MSTSTPWTVVIDDDPTGSQVVHDIEAVFGTDPDSVRAGMLAGGGVCFVLTNSRSLPEAEAVAATEAVAETVLAQAPAGRARLVSRGDSTLRGHVFAEVEALQRVRERMSGRRHDAVLFVPAFPQAGRTTVGGIHRASVDGVDVPVSETEFARDATFGYRSSRMTEFVEEVSGGRISAADVLHLDLDDVRQGPLRVAELIGAAAGRWVTADALEPSDLEAIADGARIVEDSGATIVYRVGPGIVPSVLGIDGVHAVEPAELTRPTGPIVQGLVVVGSHTALTSRQVALARSVHDLQVLELDVPAYVRDVDDRDALLRDLTDRLATALRTGPTMLITSRERMDADTPEASLALARLISSAVSSLVAGVLQVVTPGWVVLKGGITSHDVALHGLGASRARVLGQVFPGQIGVFRAETGPLEGGSFVVFPGNVGTDAALVDTITLLQASHAGAPHPIERTLA